MRKNGKKNQPEDLQVVKRRKNQEKMAKYPTGGLARGRGHPNMKKIQYSEGVHPEINT